jgi:hypothetical protein
MGQTFIFDRIYFMITRKSPFFLLVIIIASTSLFAQKSIYSKAKLNQIDAQTVYFENKFLANNQIVKELAKKLNIEIRRKLDNGNILELKGANDIGEPIFTISESNLQASQTTHTNSFYAGGSLGINLTGSGLATLGRLGVWDGGKVLLDHSEFGNRIIQIDNTNGTSTHSTHVAGTMVAEGINPIARGMAPSTQLKAWDYNNDDAEMSAASKELLVSNHSYGQVVGWIYNDSRPTAEKWEWYGSNSVSTFEDYKFGFYDNQSRDWDQIAYNAPNYLIVKSAGNKRNENGPGISATDSTKTLEKYYLGSTSDTSYIARSRNETFDNLPTYSVAKNILTVGAVSIIPNGPNLASDIKISSFSSWGPTDDGRIKPDIVGAGVNMFSTTDLGNKAYAFLSGTSMSSPQVAGSIFLLQELFANLNGNKLMRSSTLKGLVLHTADDAGRKGPDYTYGWGLLNMEKAAKALINNDKTQSVEELSLNLNASFTKKIVANGKDPLIATICWTDPEGTASSATATNLNSRIPKLVNDLDITITDGKNTFQSWVLNPNKPADLATKGDNFRDNVEQVFIENPIPGKEYTIKITHKSVLKNNSQDYALIVTGGGGKAYCTSAPNSDLDTKIEKILVNNIDYNGPVGCTTYLDNTNLKLEAIPNQKLSLSIKTGTCGLENPKSSAIFADWNIDGDFDDANEKLSEFIINNNQSIAEIAIPANVKPGSNTRMRIIVAENNTIAPCGGYSKGETMDILISFINPKRDLAITNLLFPNENVCQNTEVDNISFQLDNKGTEPIKEGTVDLNIFENNIKIATNKFTLKSAIEGLSISSFNFPINVIFKENAKYKFEFKTNILNDENESNDNFVKEIIVNKPLLTQEPKVINCSNIDEVTLNATGKGATFWYDASFEGKLVAVGNNTQIKKSAQPAQLYASQNDVAGQIGPKTKKEYAGGTYSGNFGPKPLLTVKAPIVLESARLYIGRSGKIIFTVERISDQTPVSTVTLDVTATRNPKLGNASNGQQLDDPEDQGAIYNLGLQIPEPGNYQISIEYEDGASIFRSNQGVSGFPFNLQDAFIITGSSFNGGILKEAWYYFYNLKVKSLGCPSNQRVLATTSNVLSLTTNISSSGGNLICPNTSVVLSAIENPNAQYQWFKDSVAIAEANTTSLKVSQRGKYFVKISNQGICPNASNIVEIATKNPEKPFINSNGNLLSSTPAEAYQWLLNRKPIPGANKQDYTALETGSYAIEATIDGCKVISVESYVVILADEFLAKEGDLKLFPNPVADKLFLENTNNKVIKYRIFNLAGQKLKENSIKNINNPIISVSELPSGQYFIRLEIDQKAYIRKFIKQ